MQNFLRENQAVVKKLVLFQFGATLLGFMLSSASWKSPNVNLLTSIFATLFYLYLIYTAVWEAGAKERIRVDGGRAEEDKLRGLKVTLTANFPNILLGALAFIFTFIGVVSKWAWAGSASLVTTVIARFWQGMYNGIINYVIPGNLGEAATVAYALIYLAIVIPALAVGSWAYYMGYNEKRIIRISDKRGK